MYPYIRHTVLQAQVLCQVFNEKPRVFSQTIKEVRLWPEFPFPYRKDILTVFYFENLMRNAKGETEKVEICMYSHESSSQNFKKNTDYFKKA